MVVFYAEDLTGVCVLSTDTSVKDLQLFKTIDMPIDMLKTVGSRAADPSGAPPISCCILLMWLHLSPPELGQGCGFQEYYVGPFELVKYAMISNFVGVILAVVINAA